jgi:hypothetical protein
MYLSPPDMLRSISVILPTLMALAGCNPPDPTPRDLRVRIDSISSRVEEIRGQRFRTPVQGRYLDRADLLRIYDSVSFEEPDPADSSWDRMLWALGFVDSLGSLDGAADSVDQASIQAFYSRGVLWVTDEVRDSGKDLDVTIAHELTHALQDQRWDLAKLYREHRGLDGRLGLQYLLEGEARLVETMYARRMTDSLKVLGLFPQLSLEAFRDTLRQGDALDPEMVTLPTYHPYEQGARALALRRARGGWARVDDWFRSLPPTSCFLHPDSDCHTPESLDPSALDASPPGWRVLSDGRVGEHYMDILFSLWRESGREIPSGSVKARSILREPWRDPGPDSSVEGWRGDHFQVSRDDSGDLALAWRTGWRDSSSAERFLESYLHLLVHKQRDDEVVLRQPGVALLHDRQAGVWDRVERFGSEVWIAEGIASREPFAFPGSRTTAVRKRRRHPSP